MASALKKEENNILNMVRKEQDILPKMFFEKLSEIVNGNNFQWFFQNASLSNPTAPFVKNDDFMFTHVLFREEQGKSSGWFATFEPILYSINDKVKVNELLRMKLNLYTNQNKKVKHDSHCDILDEKDKPLKDVNTAVLNFTTCNGETKIGNKTYNSKANELIIFNNAIKHYGITQTDTQKRIVLNINWR